MQEEEREKKMDTRPEVSAIQTDNIEVDETVGDMLNELGLELEGVQVAQPEEEDE